MLELIAILILIVLVIAHFEKVALGLSWIYMACYTFLYLIPMLFSSNPFIADSWGAIAVVSALVIMKDRDPDWVNKLFEQ
jgi:hypothetical protein